MTVVTIGSILLGIYLTLQGLNLVLSEAAKDRINQAHYNAWFVVAQWKERVTSDWLFEPAFRKWFVLVAIAISVTLAALDATLFFSHFEERGAYNFLFYGIAIPFGAALGWLIFIFIMKKGIVRPLLRATGVFAVMAVLAVIVGYKWLLVGLWFDDPDVDQKAILPEFITWTMAFYAQFTAAMFWWVAVLPLVFVLALQLLLFIAEAFLQHLAQSKHGALAAWAGLVKLLKG